MIITFAKPLWFWLRTRVRPSASAVLIAADAHFCKCKRNSRLLLLLLLPLPHPRRTAKLPADASECAAAARAAGGDAMLVSSLESLPSALPAAKQVGRMTANETRGRVVVSDGDRRQRSSL